jgi:flagellar hook-associated protein 3 FlgL
MRITNNMLVNNMINYLGNNLSRMSKYQSRFASGKKIQVASDDPVVAARALRLRTDVSEVNQYKKNTEDALSWMEVTEAAMAHLTSVFQRMRELTVQGSNGVLEIKQCQNIAAEVEQLKDQTIKIANSTYAGRYVFSGFKTDEPLMNDSGIFAIDVDNSEGILYQLGVSDSLRINITAGDLFNTGGNAAVGTSGSMMQMFDNLINALNAGDSIAAGTLLTDIDIEMDNLLRVRADAGSVMNRLELTINRLDTDILNFTTLMSKNEDADIAETIMYLKSEENVYQASLSAGAKVIMPSLVDFLR